FSSRRRHTRSKRDWSSDVCSSDLGPVRHFEKRVSPCAKGGGACMSHARLRALLGLCVAVAVCLSACSTDYSRSYNRALDTFASRSEERRVGKDAGCTRTSKQDEER